ncbi:MAG: hypothetical protein A2Z99_11025 [Treponema sp. GWB1_62_6]|nr:MAG: hypothetical protein A2001_07985 [Treponema sp. GWC1_61_84]OHE71111.1 MAG: hypothetical protein A2Z99_11025 [Treponema sp. GWB1_62_6]HCM25469.1 hypothetical protein [Treponema sp.]
MKCDLCGRRDAVVYVKRVVLGAEKEARLCAECAANIEPDRTDGDVSRALSRLVDGVAGRHTGTASSSSGSPGYGNGDRRCPRCGSGLEEMLKKGEAGCSACWKAFGTEFEVLRSRASGERTKTVRTWQGRLPQILAARRAALAEIAGTRLRLQAAVDAEDYETAARCRDRLRELESETPDA